MVASRSEGTTDTINLDTLDSVYQSTLAFGGGTFTDIFHKGTFTDGGTCRNFTLTFSGTADFGGNYGLGTFTKFGIQRISARVFFTFGVVEGISSFKSDRTICKGYYADGIFNTIFGGTFTSLFGGTDGSGYDRGINRTIIRFLPMAASRAFALSNPTAPSSRANSPMAFSSQSAAAPSPPSAAAPTASVLPFASRFSVRVSPKCTLRPRVSFVLKHYDDSLVPNRSPPNEDLGHQYVYSLVRSFVHRHPLAACIDPVTRPETVLEAIFEDLVYGNPYLDEWEPVVAKALEDCGV